MPALKLQQNLRQNQLGTTIVYVTHDQVEAMTMADRIVVMQAGRIEQVGTPLELYDQPENIFVAQFIGSPSMNLVPGQVSGGKLILANGVQTGIEAPVHLLDGAQLMIGKRPETIGLTSSGASVGPAGSGTGTVTSLEPTGAETFVGIDFAGEPLRVVLRERPTFIENETVTVHLGHGPVYLFDAVSGRRLDLHDNSDRRVSSS